MKLNCLIVDDEPLARKGMAEYVKEIDYLQLSGECASATEAAGVLARGGIDLLLLDIQMPHLSGIDLLKSLSHPPMAIITTAFSEYALEGYELDVIDYLVKPIPFDRFLKAVQKAYDFHSLKLKANPTGDTNYFFVKANGKYERVAFHDILYVEAMQNYVILHLPEQKLITYVTFGNMESQLPADMFLKVHKSFLISLEHVKAVDNNEILIRHARIPVSRALREEVMKKILGDKVVSRKNPS